MDTHTAIVKQGIGALLGVTIALGLYFIVQYASSLRITGLLVEPTSNLSTSGEVRTNNRNTDPDTLRRLQRRAQQVSGQLAGQTVEQSASTATTSSLAPAPTPQDQMRRYARLTRTERVVATRTETRADTERRQRLLEGARAEKEVGAADNPAAHSGAPLSSPTSLATSGVGTSLLVILALGMAAGSSHPLRRRFIALLKRASVD